MGRWSIRCFCKPFDKWFKTSTLATSIDYACRSCSNYTVYIPIIAIIAFITLLFSIDTIRSSKTIVFSIGQPGNDPIYLNGIYKIAYEKPDGSIDVVFNIPEGAQALLKSNLSETGIDPEIFNLSTLTTPAAPPTQHPVTRAPRNNYPYTTELKYIINPKHLCQNAGPLDYIIVVHSATAYFERRMVMRETFAAKNLFGDIKHRILFLLGTTNDPKATRLINQEGLTNGDILQGDFVDSYHNLTHKGVMWLLWLTENCQNAKLIVKIDDDVFLNPFQFVKDYLPDYTAKSRTLACHVRNKGTSFIERGKGKWQVRQDEFKGFSYYPFPYCNGYFVIMTPDLLQPLLRAVKMNPFFWIDDVYLFGMLPATIRNVTFTKINTNLTMSYMSGKKCYGDKKRNCTMLATSQWHPAEKKTLWKMVLSYLTEAEKNSFKLFKLA